MAAGGPERIPELVQRFREGESLRQLAAESGVNASTIYRWMLSGIGDKDHAEAVTDCLVRRIADADIALESSTDQVAVSKHREMAKFARMDFERRRPALYGVRQTNVNVKAVTIDSRLLETADELLALVSSRHRPRVIENEAPTTLTLENDSADDDQ